MSKYPIQVSHYLDATKLLKSMLQIHDKSFVLYLEEAVIQEKIKMLGRAISQDFQDKRPVLVGILNGAFMFTTDLAKAIDIEVEITFTKFSSYYSTKSSGKVVQLIGFDNQISGKDVILVDDIIDTGLTMKKLVEEIKGYSPRSVNVASLLYKPEAATTEAQIDYLGFEIENRFVVGYGMDYDGLGRNLKDIFILPTES